MELQQEFIQENGLTEEQVTAINGEVSAHINTELGTKVHEHTENTLSKVWETVKTVTGIEREPKEKYADALTRASGLFFEGEKNSLARKQKELDDKIKAGTGNETIKQELAETKEKLDALKQKEALYAEYEENDYKGKYEKASQDMTTMQRKIAFGSVKPSFPESVNSFEAKAKWNEFQKDVEDKYNIILDPDGEPYGIDKENEFKKIKLSELVAKNEVLSELVKGRQQTGTGADPKASIKIEGVPFDVPENATPQERQKAVKEYLASQNISRTSSEYAKQFSELNKAILEKNPIKK
jgi:hypothetical protein